MRRIAVLLLTLVATLACAATARADLLTTMAQDFVDDQRLDPCKYSEEQLRQLKDLIPNDLNAYAADFVAAVDDALARRAEGACNTGGSGSPSAGTAAPPASAGPAQPPSAGTPGAVV
ncbi:MAG: hypothetical protein Q8O56_14045, partial [Solirubrobacteraceae bacterium]|nr:hypothetical protein [Solirubrobacteraceae bacterium]